MGSTKIGNRTDKSNAEDLGYECMDLQINDYKWDNELPVNITIEYHINMHEILYDG